MTQPNFEQMSREELRAYLLEHRDDEAVFHAYMDKLAREAVWVRGSQEDLQDAAHFAAFIEKAKRIQQGLESPEG